MLPCEWEERFLVGKCMEDFRDRFAKYVEESLCSAPWQQQVTRVPSATQITLQF